MLKLINIKYLLGVMLAVTAMFGAASAQNGVLEQKVHKEILRLPYYELFDHISFEIKGNTVYLDGKVRNATNKSSAENVIEDIDGVSTVVNNIDILPPSRGDDVIRQKLVNSISQMGNLSRYISYVNPPVRLIVDGGHITLEGSVATDSDRNLMNIAARSVSGAFSITNNLRVTGEMP